MAKVAPVIFGDFLGLLRCYNTGFFSRKTSNFEDKDAVTQTWFSRKNKKTYSTMNVFKWVFVGIHGTKPSRRGLRIWTKTTSALISLVLGSARFEPILKGFKPCTFEPLQDGTTSYSKQISAMQKVKQLFESIDLEDWSGEVPFLHILNTSRVPSIPSSDQKKTKQLHNHHHSSVLSPTVAGKKLKKTSCDSYGKKNMWTICEKVLLENCVILKI